jgi:heptosyltransferase-2
MQSLMIRLPNHLGDACMALPALERIAGLGVRVALAGRPWAAELFAGHPWPVTPLPAARGARIAALRAALRTRRAEEPQAGAALLLTNSFSSALEFRLAGWRPAGYATDARRLLLAPALAVPQAWSGNMHTVDYYYHLAGARFGLAPAPAPDPSLRLTEAARRRAAAALARAGADLRKRRVVLCPVAQGLHRGRNKCWSGFGRMGRELLADGCEVLLCPGPGEREAAVAAVPEARLLEPLDLGAFAAVLADAALVVANDSGSGHLAAAVNAPLVGVFGVTDPLKTRPRGARVRIVGGAAGWPAYDEVAGAVAAALAAG